MTEKRFVTKLWTIVDTDTDDRIAISDDKDILNASGKTGRIEEIKAIEDNDKIDEFTIIENDIDKDYGVSEGFWKDDNGYDLTMFQCRVNAVPDENWRDTLEKFRENTGRKSTWRDELATINDAVNAHLDWWMSARDSLTPDEKPTFFTLSDKDLKTLLLTGFKSDRIFLMDCCFD